MSTHPRIYRNGKLWRFLLQVRGAMRIVMSAENARSLTRGNVATLRAKTQPLTLSTP